MLKNENVIIDASICVQKFKWSYAICIFNCVCVTTNKGIIQILQKRISYINIRSTMLICYVQRFIGLLPQGPQIAISSEICPDLKNSFNNR